jgi:uncharacterized NAD-dependent epimerase/dehydratase family protein
VGEAPGADTLLIGIAPPGGRIPAAWRPIVLDAISRGMNIVSGLHDYLSSDETFVDAARTTGVQLVDVRKSNQTDIAQRKNIRDECLRVHTVGNDCSLGKMVVAIEITNGLKRRNYDAKFVATGQTGIMVEGDGCAVDAVIADFVSGAAERLVLDNQHHDILLIEGQGSLVHPSYSGVTLGLLHGCVPQALILCYEVGRTHVLGLEHVLIPPLAKVKQVFETMASIMHPCQIIGIAMNSRKVSPTEADEERERLRAVFRLPVCDVIRHGADELVDAVVRMKEGSIQQ